MTVDLSVVVVAHDMARELPRTLYSLSRRHQTGLDDVAYEIIVVDNGSPAPLDVAMLGALDEDIRFTRLDPAPASPATAANEGIRMAHGEAIGLIVDGARMASPGLLAGATLGLRVADRAVVASLGWHLGGVRHGEAAAAGYNQATEDALLESLGWHADGYRLFEASTLANSSVHGWFGPISESSALFMSVDLWNELEGLDPAFALPGGGLVNHDLYRRALETPGTQLVVLLGEGTFHQIHGGAATSGRFGWDEMQADYERIRGRPWEPPSQDPIYVGKIPAAARPHLLASIDALDGRSAPGRGDPPAGRRSRLRRGRRPS